MKKEWLPAFGQMVYGIYVLTTRAGDVMNGMIASWVSQVSYSPPLIMAAVHPNRYSNELIEKSGVFALHVLDRSQKDYLDRFKIEEPAKKFSGLSWKTGKTGVPLLDDCLACFELEVTERYCPGNHTLFIGKVVDCTIRSPGTPLLTLDYEKTYLGKS
ncbi:flavin reductase family protein [Desulforhopalus singaporensis]|uniref:NADH-FMN oxidoreductase RutF, flavin reductase (DIM6/NTAB) family n=1 Tax=Desulforhopalus singaporensis TaxID=91360 RepID=A0A1H0VGN2_9BACT|nr:flavin reductase family protein [Desulforhopalus singaporensis]SDP77647.1 NADH-FMN oxidoreductase RutF, flavin reductase (DIM6/NTAB) family [Desulforhopalus singaporensis]